MEPAAVIVEQGALRLAARVSGETWSSGPRSIAAPRAAIAWAGWCSTGTAAPIIIGAAITASSHRVEPAADSTMSDAEKLTVASMIIKVAICLTRTRTLTLTLPQP